MVRHIKMTNLHMYKRCPVLKHGGLQIKKNLNKEIKARSVHCPQHHCAKKASITTTREQSVIVTSQLLAAGYCIDDVTIGQYF